VQLELPPELERCPDPELAALPSASADG